MLVFRPIMALNRRLHAIRIFPFLRANAIAVVLFALVAFVAASETWEAIHSTTEAAPTPLEYVLGNHPIANPHVEVTGLVFPRRNVAYTLRSARPPVFVYVAMLHEPTLRVLLVRFPGDLGHGEPRELIVQGMLQPFDAQVAKKLKADNWKIAGLPVDRRYVLIAGAKPVPLWLFAPVAALSSLLAVALVVAMIFDRFRTSKEPTSP